MSNTSSEVSEDVRAAAAPASTQLKFDGPKINMDVVKEVTEQMTGSVQSHDMFFSCCDWEAAMEAEKKGLTSGSTKTTCWGVSVTVCRDTLQSKHSPICLGTAAAT